MSAELTTRPAAGGLVRKAIGSAALAYSWHARAKRAEMFRRALSPTAHDRILDLGSEDGSHIASEFDIVFCSSVIEHVTVPKDRIHDSVAQASFAAEAHEHQRRFAAEIERVGRRYFVQTPNKWFPIESHTWLPLPIVLLPRGMQLRVVGWLEPWWIKGTGMDWHLLTRREMSELFPSAEIVVERSLGLPKSLIAIRR